MADLDRRALLKGLAAGMAGSVATPDPASGDTAATASSPAAEAIQASPAPSGPRLLGDHQRKTLSSLADMILPGAVAAGVLDLIDRVAAVEPASTRRRLLNALAHFDKEAQALSGAPWIALSVEMRTEVLTRASHTPPGQSPSPPWKSGDPFVFDAPPSGPASLRDHFDLIRSTVVNAFAATETGMKALGWTGRSAWRELPGCAHPDPEKH
ncbi:MAG: gluconate 2-dehydrogenase subunit 3 family protein [Acidobacteriota bacterium]